MGIDDILVRPAGEREAAGWSFAYTRNAGVELETRRLDRAIGITAEIARLRPEILDVGRVDIGHCALNVGEIAAVQLMVIEPAAQRIAHQRCFPQGRALLLIEAG